MNNADYDNNYDDRKHVTAGGFSSGNENGGRRGYAKRERFEGGEASHRYGARTIVRGRGGGGGGRYPDDRQPRRRSLSDGSYLAKNDGGYQQQNYRGDANGYYAHNGYPPRYQRRNTGRGDRFGGNNGFYASDDHPGANNYAGANENLNADDQSGAERHRRGGWPRRRFGGRRPGGDRRRRRGRSDERGAGGDSASAAPTQLRDRATDDEAEREEGAEPNDHKPKPYTTLTPEELPEGSFTVKVLNLPKSKNVTGLYYFMAYFGKVTNMHVLPPTEHRRKKRPPRENRRRSRKDGAEVATKSELETSKEDEQKGENGAKTNEVCEKSPSPKVEDDKKSDVAVEQKAVVNDESAAADDDSDQFEVIESYVAFVTFDSPQAANKAITYNNRHCFGNKLKVQIYRPQRQFPAAEERHKAKKQKGFAGLDETFLAKMFEMMDFHTRGQAQLVCDSWNRAMCHVKSPAPDAPDGISVTVRSSQRKENQRERIKLQYDKDSRSVVLSSAHPRFNDETFFRARKICAQMGVTSFRASYVTVTGNLLAIVESLQDNVDVSFENCWTAGGVDLGRLTAVVRRFGDRFVVTTSPRKLRSSASASDRRVDDADDDDGGRASSGKSSAVVDDEKKAAADGAGSKIASP